MLLLLSRRVKYLSPLKGDVVLALINEKTHLLNNSFDEAVGVSGKGKVAYGRGLAKIPGIVHASGSYQKISIKSKQLNIAWRWCNIIQL